jgi:hypothetical protein
MCLDVVLNRKQFLSETNIVKNKRNTDLKVGWKVVRIKGEKVKPPHFDVDKKSFSVGKWLNEKDFRRDAYTNDTKVGNGFTIYKIGFHVLTSYEDANQYCNNAHLGYRYARIIKVYYKKAVAYGKQSGAYTIITKEMYIPRQFPFTRLGNKSRKRLE